MKIIFQNLVCLFTKFLFNKNQFLFVKCSLREKNYLLMKKEENLREERDEDLASNETRNSEKKDEKNTLKTIISEKRKRDAKKTTTFIKQVKRKKNIENYCSFIMDGCEIHNADKNDHKIIDIYSIQVLRSTELFLKTKPFKMINSIFSFFMTQKTLRKLLCYTIEEGDLSYRLAYVLDLKGIYEHQKQYQLINILKKYLNLKKLYKNGSEKCFIQCFFSLMCFFNSKMDQNDDNCHFLKNMFRIESTFCTRVSTENFDYSIENKDQTDLDFVQDKLIMHYTKNLDEKVKCKHSECLSMIECKIISYPKYIIVDSNNNFEYFFNTFTENESGAIKTVYFYDKKYKILGFVVKNNNYDVYMLNNDYFEYWDNDVLAKGSKEKKFSWSDFQLTKGFDLKKKRLLFF